MQEKTTEYYGKYHLSEDEQNALAKEIARDLLKIVMEEEEMKDRHSGERADIKQQKENLVEGARNVKQGFVQKYFTCTVEYEEREGMKHFRDVESDEIVGSEPMTKKELQDARQTNFL